MFTQHASKKMNEENRNKILNELFNLLTKEEAIAWLIDLMESIRDSHGSSRTTKNLCTLNQRDKIDIDPLFDLEVKRLCIKHVIISFGS